MAIDYSQYYLLLTTFALGYTHCNHYFQTHMDLTGLTGTIPQNGMLQCNQHANTANSKPSRTARMSKTRDTF